MLQVHPPCWARRTAALQHRCSGPTWFHLIGSYLPAARTQSDPSWWNQSMSAFMPTQTYGTRSMNSRLAILRNYWSVAPPIFAKRRSSSGTTDQKRVLMKYTITITAYRCRSSMSEAGNGSMAEESFSRQRTTVQGILLSRQG